MCAHCVCPRYNLKTIADIYFLLSAWRKISDEFACQGHRSSSRSFLEGSRSLGTVMRYSVAGIVRFRSPIASSPRDAMHKRGLCRRAVSGRP